jgi:hypothetical protein
MYIVQYMSASMHVSTRGVKQQESVLKACYSCSRPPVRYNIEKPLQTLHACKAMGSGILAYRHDKPLESGIANNIQCMQHA